MTLRNHPLMREVNWPPTWSLVDTLATHQLDDPESGVLTQVRVDDLSCSKISVRMKRHGKDYVADLNFDEKEFCWYVHYLLRASLGKSIKEIGEIEIDWPSS